LLRLWISRKRRKEETLLVNATIAWVPQSLLSPSVAREPYGQKEKGEVLIGFVDRAKIVF
jgi:hypothetical protein